MTLWRRNVALGDPFTEDRGGADHAAREPWLDWADRLASILDGNARLLSERLEFVKIEMGGGSIQELVDDHVPRALELQP
ncbi:MAG: SGNH/GDSL hydrolase family protein, partial [Salinibacterium sp.]|nr:SGNH/GDSL hydrolase family protein [Salinibacterium sp.]